MSKVGSCLTRTGLLMHKAKTKARWMGQVGRLCLCFHSNHVDRNNITAKHVVTWWESCDIVEQTVNSKYVRILYVDLVTCKIFHNCIKVTSHYSALNVFVANLMVLYYNELTPIIFFYEHGLVVFWMCKQYPLLGDNKKNFIMRVCVGWCVWPW